MPSKSEQARREAKARYRERNPDYWRNDDPERRRARQSAYQRRRRARRAFSASVDGRLDAIVEEWARPRRRSDDPSMVRELVAIADSCGVPVPDEVRARCR